MSHFNKAIVRRALEEGINRHNIGVIAELYPNCVYHSPATGDLRGEAYKQFVASLFVAFPDGQWTIEDQLAEGEEVMTRWTFVGTHRGMFKGIAPTGRKLAITGIVIDRIVNGRIVEEWEEWDSLGMMRQLGVVPEIKVGELVGA
jgi:predicted ester cyclase